MSETKVPKTVLMPIYHEYHTYWAVIPITPLLLRLCLDRVQSFQKAVAKDRDLVLVRYLDWTPEVADAVTVGYALQQAGLAERSDGGSPDYIDEFEGNETIHLDQELAIPDQELVRIESSVMNVTNDWISWTFREKNSTQDMDVNDYWEAQMLTRWQGLLEKETG